MFLTRACTAFGGIFSAHRGILLVLAATAAILAPMLAIGFISDDVALISFAFNGDHPDPARLLGRQELAGLYYRPLVDLSFAMDFTVWGWNPLGFRLTALILHLAVTGSIYLLTRRLFHDDATALLGAAFFGVLPIHEMSLFWIAGRTDVLCALFFLLSLWLLARHVQEHRAGVSILSLAAFLMAMLCKEMAFSLPLLAPFIIARAREVRKERAPMGFIIRASLPYALLAAGLLAVRMLALGNNPLTGNSGMHGTATPVQILANFAIYFGLLIIPTGHQAMEGVLAVHRHLVLAGAAGAAVLALAMLWGFRSRLQPLWLPLLWIIITILPVSRLAMRWYLYIPSAGFCMALGWLIARIERRSLRRGIALLLWAGYAAILLVQNLQWIHAGELAGEYLAGLPSGLRVTGSDTLTFLTVPSKIGTAPLFNLGFQRTLQHHFHSPDLQVRILSKVVMEHEPMQVNILPGAARDTVVLDIGRDGYFFLDNSDLKAGRASATSGAVFSTDYGEATVISLNSRNKPERIGIPVDSMWSPIILFDGRRFTLMEAGQ